MQAARLRILICPLQLGLAVRCNKRGRHIPGNALIVYILRHQINIIRLQLGLAVQMHYCFDSKFLINHCTHSVLVYPTMRS